MANNLFFSSVGRNEVKSQPLVVNAAGGSAVALSDEDALVQLICTGFLANTFYTTAEQQFGAIKERFLRIMDTDPEFIAKLAIYSRDNAFMKDTPALLLALMASDPRALPLLKRIFNTVVDNEKILRNFIQMIRSGKVGRKSLGTSLKRLVSNWINKRDTSNLFKGNIGNNPSVADIIRLAHVKPETKEREVLYNYLLGGNKLFGSFAENKTQSVSVLPELVRNFESWRVNTKEGEIPAGMPFQIATSFPLTDVQWKSLARTSSWHTALMNLNTFERHGVFKDQEMISVIASKLANRDLIKRSKVFPHQIYAAIKNFTGNRSAIVAALNAALTISFENVPFYNGKSSIYVDVSGSMHAPVSGYRGAGTSSVRCDEMASLFAAAIHSVNPDSQVYAFADDVKTVSLANCKSSPLVDIARTIQSANGGGTNIAAVVDHVFRQLSSGVNIEVVYILSDNQSWGHGQPVSNFWGKVTKINPTIKVVCLDLQADVTVQIPSVPYRSLNIGGFSSNIFNVIYNFLAGQNVSNALLFDVKKVVLPA